MPKVQPIAGIASELTQNMCAALEKLPEVEKAILFGSRALGTYRSNSDIDLCIEAPRMAFSHFLQLAGELDELVMPYSLDLVMMHQIDNPDLIDHIHRVGQVIYVRSSAPAGPLQC